jgi:hypothetical protein
MISKACREVLEAMPVVVRLQAHRQGEVMQGYARLTVTVEVPAVTSDRPDWFSGR